jgi:hypothetical protein
MTLAALGRDLKSVIAQKTSIGTQESALGLTPSCGLTTAAGTSSKFLPPGPFRINPPLSALSSIVLQL